MKLTFAAKTYAARSFRCATLVGPAVLGPYRADEAEVACCSAAAGDHFQPGADVGQDYNAGTTAGLCHG